MSNHVRGCILARPSSSGRRAQRFSHASINVTPRALHLKIDDNNLLHLPRGVWPASKLASQLVNQLVNQPVSRCDRPTNCLGRQLALSCPCQRWRCSIWFNLDAPLDARLPMRLAAAVFDTIYTKCRSFWRFAFVADSIVPRGPWPVARSRCLPGRAMHRTVARPYCCHKTTTSGCTLLQQN